VTPAAVLLLISGLGAAVALSVVPLLLPWPQQVRCLVASANIPDPVAPPLGGGAPIWRSVTVGRVRHTAVGAEIEIVDVPSVHASSVYLAPLSGVTSAAADLEGWAAAHTPLLLLLLTGAGEASLHGPVSALVGLRRAGACDPVGVTRSIGR